MEDGGRAVGIPDGIQHFFVAVPEDDMQLKVRPRLTTAVGHVMFETVYLISSFTTHKPHKSRS